MLEKAPKCSLGFLLFDNEIEARRKFYPEFRYESRKATSGIVIRTKLCDRLRECNFVLDVKTLTLNKKLF